MRTITRAFVCLICVVAAGVSLDKSANFGGGALRWEDALSLGLFDSLVRELVVANGTLFAIGEGPLRHSPSTHADIIVKAYDPRSGKVLWSHRRASVFEDEKSAGIVASGDRVVYAGSSDPLFTGSDYLFAQGLDARSGEMIWEDRCAPSSLSSPVSIVSQGDRVFVGGACGGSGFLRAYDPADGSVIWDAGENAVHKIAAEGDRVYAIERSAAGAAVIRSVEAATGATVWRVTRDLPQFAGFVLRVAAHGGLVFAGWRDASQAQQVEALDAATGASVWARDVGQLAGVITPHGRFVFVGTQGDFQASQPFIRAYDARTGETLWEHLVPSLPGIGVGGISAQGSTVVVSAGGSPGFSVEALDASSGLLQWDDLVITARPGVGGPVAWHGSSVFVGGQRGNLVLPFGTVFYLIRAYSAH